MTDVAVIAQSPAVRVGLRVLLESDATLRVVGDGALLNELERAPLASAEVVVLHNQSPASIQRLPSSVRGVLFVIAEWTTDWMPRTDGLTWGVVPADVSAEELIAAVNALDHGLIVVHPAFADRLVTPPDPRDVSDPEPLIEPLTARESEVLQLIGQGLANKMIADRLHISEHTVKFHVSAIYAKLGVASRTEAVRAGARRGLIVL